MCWGPGTGAQHHPPAQDLTETPDGFLPVQEEADWGEGYKGADPISVTKKKKSLCSLVKLIKCEGLQTPLGLQEHIPAVPSSPGTPRPARRQPESRAQEPQGTLVPHCTPARGRAAQTLSRVPRHAQ